MRGSGDECLRVVQVHNQLISGFCRSSGSSEACQAILLADGTVAGYWAGSQGGSPRAGAWTVSWILTWPFGRRHPWDFQRLSMMFGTPRHCLARTPVMRSVRAENLVHVMRPGDIR